ncbi:hypothetical protein NBRGN_060_01240 [Nocardia brasiliensis NBRC 14402]|nr:hypothetical protein NBRGN_060_01240 [Nocardia brasiliensis NBRC 14402]SUB54628.1 Uncharacterised protein [Nocardia brasiliensis]
MATRALVEIRYLAGAARRQEPDAVLADDVERIRFLANLCHNLPWVALPSKERPWRKNMPLRSYDQAIARRPMAYTWETASPEGRAWILHEVDQHYRWTPPPPLPAPRVEPPHLSWWRWIGWPGQWPVRPPDGHRALPRQARVLKALDADAVCALYPDPFRSWLRHHLDPESTHYLVPDPSDYDWPDPKAEISFWWCRTLVRMSDGALITDSVRVPIKTFAALPSTVPRRRQRRLLHLARAVERDLGLWNRDRDDDGTKPSAAT